jgi:hypothetical protein
LRQNAAIDRRRAELLAAIMASVNDSKKFLGRITVNQQAVEAARDKTLIAITRLYPDLAIACSR